MKLKSKMVDAKYTPGPWAIAYGHKSNAMGVFQEMLIGFTESTPICLLSPVDKCSDIDRANGKLIAAAPDLLEALAGLYEFTMSLAMKVHPNDFKELRERWNIAMQATELAIKKVEE